MESKEDRLHGIVESIVRECKGWINDETVLPSDIWHSSNTRLQPETRRKLAFLEDQLAKADTIMKGKLTRITRDRMLTPEEAAKDDEIREQVKKDFPPEQ